MQGLIENNFHLYQTLLPHAAGVRAASDVAAVSNQPGNAPREAERVNVGVAPLGLLQQAELVPAPAPEVAARVRVRRLRAVRRLRVAANLDLDLVQREAPLRLEEEVEDVVALRRGCG